MSERKKPADSAIRLFSLAESQGGYFTGGQALRSGYSYRVQHYHVQRGNWIRIGRGLFRLRAFPLSEREELIRWNFWSLQKGVISHDSALEYHRLGDIVPDKVHLTVPAGFRKTADNVVLHRGGLPGSDLETHVGFRVTTPIRTLLDVAASPLAQERLEDSVRQAIQMGRVRPRALLARAARLGKTARRRLESALSRSSAA